jgi:subtilase family serine protease
MKKTSTLILRNSLLLFAILFTISSFSATAQTAPQSKLATPRITQAIDEANLVTLRRSVYPLARAEYDQGVVPDSMVLNRILLVLQRSPEQETALRSLMDAQQTKNSPNYHAWLTPAQFGQQFGVADADIQKVTDWLSQKGFTGAKATGPGKMFIEFSGTAGTVRTALHTEIHSFLVNGQTHFANVSDPQIPAALAPVVARIHSLHDFRKKSYLVRSKLQARPNADGKQKPGWGTGTGVYLVAPPDLATIYNIPATVAGSPAGTGQTIAIVARANLNVSDINQFGAAFTLPNLTNFSAANNIIVNGPDPGIVAGDSDEATADVEMVGSVAPNATILLVVNQGTITGNLAGLGALADDSTDGVDQSALYIVDNNLAPVMNQSFGSCEADTDNQFSSTLWEQAAAQGITVTVSTGDTGSDICDHDLGNIESTFGLSVSGSASTPFNVAVGGTDFNDASNPTLYWNDAAALETAKGYIPEMTWNNGCAATATSTTLNTVCTSVDPSGLDLSGGSGGQSNCATNNGVDCTGGYPKPTWQSAPGVPTDQVRDIPDVSLFAAVNSPTNNGYVICDSGANFLPGQPCNFTGSGTGYNFAIFGGTSLSSPAFAGMVALVNQSELAAGRGGRQGNANYVLYKLATAQTASACNSTTGPAATCTFNDVTVGNNSVICDPGSPNCSNQTASGFGVLVEPSTPNPPFSATTPAWTTTTGYDLATGLGSVNASNLIANWGTVTTNFKAATPAITSPASGAVSITHGTNQSFTISVTSASGTPTGDVSLIAEPPGFGQVGAGFATLTNGTATIVTNMLPGDDTTGAGTPYPVIAHYAGDGTFAPGDSAPINVTVNRENSTTVGTLYAEDLNTDFLTAATSIQYGTDYIMVVDVVGATAGVICNNTSTTSVTQIPTVPCPTGTITLKNNGVPMNDFIKTGANNTNSSTVGNLGFVEDLLIQLSGGPNPIVAAYSGDNSYNPSTSATNTITVTPAPTQTVVQANGSTTASVGTGQSVTLVATVNTVYTQPCGNTGSGPTGTCQSVSNGVGPTGTVTFSSCGTAASCTVPVVPTSFNTTSGAGAFSTGTLTTSFATTGTPSISATFTSGDLNYANCAAASATCTLTPLSLTVSGAVGTATQLVFITQPSNVPVGVSITPAVQVAVEDVNGNIVAGATTPVKIVIGTNPGAGTLGGTATVTPVNGIATFSNLSISAAGTGYTLAASATGLTGVTSAPFNVINPASKLVFIVQPANTNTGAPIIPAVQVAIEDVNGNFVTGAINTVTIAIGTNPGGGTLGGTLTASPVNGVATFPNLSVSAAGTGYTLTAAATGLTGATSSAFNVITTAAKLAFVVQPANSFTGKSIAPAVQVAIQDVNGNIVGGATTPVTIVIGTNPGPGTLTGTTTVSPSLGVATFSNLNINTAGTGYTLTASAAGLTGATSTAFNETVPPTPAIAVGSSPLTLSSATGAASGSTITVTPSGGFTGIVAVTPTAASLPPGVTCTPSPLNINITGTTAVTGTLNCQVTATSTALSASNARENRMLEAKTIPTTTTGKGWWSLSAGTGFAALFLLFLPGGRKKYRAALGLGLVCILSLTLGCNGAGSGTPPPGLTPTTTKMTVNNDKVPNGTAFTFNVAVTGGTPTGQVQLFDGGTMIGTAATVASGSAAPTAPALAVGTHAISAHYLGDSTTAASASGVLNLTVTGPTTIAITTNPVATPAATPIVVTIN